jgi:hypothetical protein
MTKVALALAGMTAGLALGTPATAQAAGISVSCSASGKTLFSPGVQLFPIPQQVTYRGAEEECTDTSAVGIREAKITANFQNVILSCLAGGIGTGTGSGSITWTLNNGAKATSWVELRIDRTVLNVASVSGHVRQGVFAGQSFSGDFSTDLLGGAGKCTLGAPFGGVKEAAFTGNFSIG